MSTTITSEADFKALLAANTFVVVDFSAAWCGPCKAIAPLFAKLADQHAVAGQLAFAKIDVDEVPAVAQEYGVASMPTFLFFAQGARASVNVAPRKPGATVEAEDADPASKVLANEIKGADPRALMAVAARLGEIARASAEA